MNKPRVTLVGAGPGDPKLLTLKGAEALIDAKVVLYDALVNQELLKYAATAELIFVGKRKGNHRFTQNEINQKLVEKAFEKGNVVRLKGGDPYIFGRGSEEIEFVDSFGIETSIIPGITSAISVPAKHGISLTKRGVAESLWILTGTTSSRKLSADIKLAAKSTATLVVLMGMGNLDKIVKILQETGKGKTPIGIIQNGYMKNENIGVGEIDSILEIVEDKKLSSPAIIVIGEVVRLSYKLREIYASYETVDR